MAAKRSARNAQLLAERERGASINTLAERFGISKQRAHQLLIRYGGHQPKQQRLLDPDAARQLVALRAEGKTHRALADHFGVSTTTVKRALRRAGVAQ